MARDLFSPRPTPELSPEERERQDPKTLLQFTIDENGQIDKTQPWNKNVIPIHCTFQLLKESITGQFALIAWPKTEFESNTTINGYKEFKQPKGYRTSYEHFEEIGLYSSLKEANEKMRSVHSDFDPLVEMQDTLDTVFRNDV
ncbi:TPA: hypothetical protein DCW61_03100 [Candidatus Uhrbacteria bacterium]|nr:hypothetical protein [Candidatus Uhrbacteria bacterium]